MWWMHEKLLKHPRLFFIHHVYKFLFFTKYSMYDWLVVLITLQNKEREKNAQSHVRLGQNQPTAAPKVCTVYSIIFCKGLTLCTDLCFALALQHLFWLYAVKLQTHDRNNSYFYRKDSAAQQTLSLTIQWR